MKKKYLSSLLLIVMICSGVYAQDYKGVIKSYLDENFQQLELLQEDVDQWIVTNEVYSKRSNITHVYVQQSHNGIPVFGAVANFAMKDSKVLFSNTKFISNLSKNINSSNPNSTPNYAIEKAATELNLGKTDKISVVEYKDVNEFIYSKSGISQENIPVSLVYQPMEDGSVKLAWNLTIYQLDGKHWWNVRLDATTGVILDKNDYNTSCNFHVEKNTSDVKSIKKKSIPNKSSAKGKVGEQYNVFALPVESPSFGSRSVITNPHNIVASPFGWHDDDGADGAEYTITRGNNVYAQEDVNGDDGFGAAPDGTATLNFNFPLDLNQQPINYQDASLTNLFYANNVMHDIWFQYGFDQAAGSFQTNNYEAVSIGSGDPVIADGQDGSGTDNANFGTPPDGGSPRMQMFLWSPPPADLLTVNSPSRIAGSFIGKDSNYGGPALSDTPITSDLVLAEDDTVLTEDACTALINGSEIAGKIAVIRRGDCDFTQKVQFAQDAGAIAVIMVNNVVGNPILMAGTSTTITIPAIMIAKSIGDTIIDALNSNDTINVTLQAPAVGETGLNIDGSFENGIIAHEYGHGISNRLVGGPGNTSCLGNAEQMGEGWSDFFGLMITMKSTDTENDARGIGTYANGEPVDGTGIREYRYSPDMSINPFTFNDVKDVAIPHGVGSVWATMLWDLNWKMIETYGFDPDLYNGTGGNNMTMALVTEGLKLTPCNPGFVDGRNAILRADLALYGGANACLIWKVFARRGLGGSADSGSISQIDDQVVSFELPEIRGCTLGVDNSNLDLFNIYPNPSNGLININGVGINEEVKISIFDINGRKVFEKESALNGNTSIKAKELTAGFYILKIQGKEFTHNEKIIIE
ncbi:MAG: extracellular elastinolytic metalloproteinase [Saprospiraceae bacterium]|jgi:extracellular elastinolytic metalloproteinase